jgi:hypothetical protein
VTETFEEQCRRADERAKKANDALELTNDVVIDLAGMTPLEYAKQLGRTAKKHKVPMRLLEKAVEAARVEIEVEKLLEPHWGVMASDDPVDAAKLFADIEARILHHIAMPKHLAFVCSLWIGFSWIHVHATYSPILFVTSPERDSGKSTLMGVIEFLVRRSLSSVGISGPALYRSIEKWGPTFVIDEADKAFVQNLDLEQAVNSGWTRGQGVIRCDPETHEPRKYSTFCPKAIAMKGKDAPDTTLSRAIFILMKRRTRDEAIADFAHFDDDGFQRLRSHLARWAADNGATLGVAKPAQPDGFINRLAANWKLLFAIADSLGGEAGRRARAAARQIAGVTDLPSAGVELLMDIKAHFDASTLDYVTSKRLLEVLKVDEEKPWAEWSRGKPISEKGVARLLHEYRILSKTVGPRGDEAKGYRKEQFAEAWKRYVEPAKAAEGGGEEPEEKAENSDTPILPSKRRTLCNGEGKGEHFAVEDAPLRRENNRNFPNENKAVDLSTGKPPDLEPSSSPFDPGPIPECLQRAPNGSPRWVPALGPAGDDVFDIDPRWRSHTLTAASSVGRQS